LLSYAKLRRRLPNSGAVNATRTIVVAKPKSFEAAVIQSTCST
jgi:uncharacterized protein YqiB (DUF1249 family)